MATVKLLFLAVNLLLLTTLTSGSKILFVGVQMRSHVMQQLVVAEELAAKGHQVHFVVGSRYPDLHKLEKKKLIPVPFHIPEGIPYFCTDDVNKMTTKLIFNMTDAERVQYQMGTISGIVQRDCSYMMNDTQFMSYLQNIQFDIAIVEPFLLNPCSLILARRLRIKFVSFPALVFPWDIRMPVLPSAVRLAGSWPLLDLKSFRNRLRNLISFFFVKISFLNNLDTRLLKEYASDLNSWDELVRESELFIVERDHLLDDVLPATPNYITLPGLTGRMPKPLPDDLENTMSANENGVILMTFGSLAGHMPDSIAIKFLKAFSMLNQTVLAKLEAPVDAIVPDNVKLFSWVPQNDILGHRNMRLFITHCGNNGQYEAVYHGVPMIGFPLFAEQPTNCQRIITKNYGLCMKIFEFSPEELYNNIHEILSNSKYSTAIKKSSEIARSEPMNSREKAVYWIEHVIKFGGNHLRTDAMQLPLYQFLMLDIIAAAFLLLLFILIAAAGVIYLIWCKVIVKLFTGKSKLKTN